MFSPVLLSLYHLPLQLSFHNSGANVKTHRWCSFPTFPSNTFQSFWGRNSEETIITSEIFQPEGAYWRNHCTLGAAFLRVVMQQYSGTVSDSDTDSTKVGCFLRAFPSLFSPFRYRPFIAVEIKYFLQWGEFKVIGHSRVWAPQYTFSLVF